MQLVDHLLENEGDPDAISVKDYLLAANTWNEIDLISTTEWRTHFRSLGWRVSSIYRHKSKPERRYAYMSMTVVPKDGHPVDYLDGELLRDYMYEFLERRFGKKRSQMDYVISVSAYGTGIGAYAVDFAYGLNQIDILIRERGMQDRIQWQFLW